MNELKRIFFGVQLTAVGIFLSSGVRLVFDRLGDLRLGVLLIVIGLFISGKAAFSKD